MRNITETLMTPLEKFRKDQLGAVKVMHEGSFPFLSVCLVGLNGSTGMLGVPLMIKSAYFIISCL